MIESSTDGPVFDGDPDWRIPLRVGMPPGRITDFADGPPNGLFTRSTADLVRRVDLGSNGLECDILVVRRTTDLESLVGSTTLSANLVLIVGHAPADIDPDTAFAAARSVGAIGYVITDFDVEHLRELAWRVTRGATVLEALTAAGSHNVVADSAQLEVRPIEAYLRSVARIHQPARRRGAPERDRGTGAIERRDTNFRGFPRALDADARERRPVLREQSERMIEEDPQLTARELDRRRAGPVGVGRFLQAALHRLSPNGAVGERVQHGLLRYKPMVLLLGIGPLGPARLIADVALDEARLGEPEVQGWELEIVVKSDMGGIERHTLQLPISGASADLRIPVQIDPDSNQWCGRITVLHRARAIQSATLCCPVIDTDIAPETGVRPTLTVDGEFHPMAGLESHSAGGAIIELDASPAVYTGTGDYLIEAREDEMRAASNRIAAKLGDMAVELDEISDLDHPTMRMLLEHVAVQGSLLLKALFPSAQQRDAVKKERFLQELRLSDAAGELPYEFIYDLDSPPRDFTLCTEWRAGVAEGRCPRCHADGANNRNTLCPLGFWGLSKVIERHNMVGSGESRAQARLRRGNVAGKERLHVERAVVAFSDKADKLPRGAGSTYEPPSQRILRALKAAAISTDGPVTDWHDWERLISTSQPDLLVVLGHAWFDDERGEWSMQIGERSDLYLSRVFPEYVDCPPGVPGPLVLLFGCLTSSEGSEQATFAREFRQRNASVVIGTTSTVLGRQAGPVAADLISAIKVAEGEQRLGELLRRARVSGLTKGSVMAMALTALGDADYQITA